MPYGMRGGGRPGGMPGGMPPMGPMQGPPGRGYPVRGRRFPRFNFYPVYYGQPYSGCAYMERYGRCCDMYGRRDDNYGGGNPLAGGFDNGENSSAPGRNMMWDNNANYSYDDYDRDY